MHQNSYGLDEGIGIKQTHLDGINRFNIRSPNESNNMGSFMTSQDEDAKSRHSIMSKLFGLVQVPLSVGPTGRHNMAENEPIDGSEYADSESATARELPDLQIMDNFESGILASNESESN